MLVLRSSAPRRLYDSVRPVDGQTRSPLASDFPLPTSQKDIRPDHRSGAPAGAARPALCVGVTHPPPPPPPPPQLRRFHPQQGPPIRAPLPT